MRYAKRDRVKRLTTIVIFLGMLITGIGLPLSYAERDRERGHYRAEHWELDMRHAHDRYYPARRYVVPALPPGALHFPFGGHNFYFRSGVWFQATGPNFMVVSPPPGIVIPLLPPGYSILSVGGLSYYYANDTYYAPVQGGSGYMVVAPPPGYETGFPPAPVPPPSAPMAPQASSASSSGLLYVYPRDNQTPEQIKVDREECDRWAREETVSASSNPNDLRRAASACLEGRGYTIK